MLIKKILLPVDFPAASVPVFQQAATLAAHFQAEIVMLHVATPESQKAGVPVAGAPIDERALANWNLLAEILQKPENKIGQPLRAELEARVVRGVVTQGDPARAILEAAQTESADLIMMPSHGHTFDEFLLGSVTAKVLRWRECPLWTGAHTDDLSAKQFAIHKILCAVDLGRRSEKVASFAALLTAEFSAHLTLANVTESMAIVSPGGTWANPKYQEPIVDDAFRRLTALQKTLHIDAEVLIGSGDVPKVLSEMVNKTKADLLVLDCYPYSGNLRIHGYGIICAVSIPVLSV